MCLSFRQNNPLTRPVLDMAEVTAVDAAGLGLLVELRNWACKRRTQLRLLNVTPYLEKLLRITNLVRILDVCSVREMMDLQSRDARGYHCHGTRFFL